MTEPGYHTTNVRGVPPDLKAALIADSAARGSNMSDVAVDILAATLGVAFTPSGGKTKDPSLGDQLQLRMPQQLHRALWSAVQETPYTRNGLILMILARHYAIRYTPARRSGGRRAEAKA